MHKVQRIASDRYLKIFLPELVWKKL